MTAPVRVTGVGDVVGLSAGLYQTCLRLEDGTVPCFGFYPREGDNSARSSVPTPVAGFAGAVALAGGEWYECAVVPDRTVRCFGYNDYGWLGDGTLTTHPDTDTVAAVGIDTAVDITASFSHACALLEGGSAACWGFERHGELGTPPSEDQWTPVPQPVPGIDGITAISAGWGFTCAVVAGSGLCWGRNEEGELGDRTIVSRPTPAPLSWVPDTTAPTVQAPLIGIRADDKELRGNRVDVRIEPTGADDPGGTRHRPLRAPGQHRRWLDVEPAPFAGQTLQSERAHDRVDDAPVPGRGPRSATSEAGGPTAFVPRSSSNLPTRSATTARGGRRPSPPTRAGRPDTRRRPGRVPPTGSRADRSRSSHAKRSPVGSSRSTSTARTQARWTSTTTTPGTG